MRAGLDRLDHDREVGQHHRGQDEHVAARHEDEKGGGGDAADQHDLVEPGQPDVVLDVPKRHDHQRVGAHLELQEALVRNQRRQHRRHARDDDRVNPRPRRAAVDPDEEADQQQRRDHEHVPFDDCAGEAGGEGGDDDQRPSGQRDRGGDERLHPRLQRADPRRQQQERREGDHADVEVELGEMPEEVLQHVDDVIALLAHDLVSAEETRDRTTSRELGADHEYGAARDDPKEGQPRTQRSPGDELEQQRGGQRPQDDGDALHAHERDDTARRKQDELASQRRFVERAQQRPGCE